MAEIVETVRERYNLRKNVAQKIDTQGQCYVNETESSDSLERANSRELSFIGCAKNIKGIDHTKDRLYSREEICYIVYPFCVQK